MLASRALDFLPICYIIPHPGEHGNLIFIKMVKTLLLTLQFTRQPLAGKAHAHTSKGTAFIDPFPRYARWIYVL